MEKIRKTAQVEERENCPALMPSHKILAIAQAKLDFHWNLLNKYSTKEAELVR